MTTASAPNRIPFAKNVLLKVLLGWYILLWAAMAVSPMDRPFWMLASVLPVMLIGALIATHRSFPLSDVSYLVITFFLSLHVIGAHYTYANVPFGLWLEDILGFHRNHFDRIVHFLFGFLFIYPFRELLIRKARITGFWAYALTLSIVMACAGMWEVLESWVARTVSPELGMAALGAQGDIWDAQRDIASAFYGAVLCTLAIVAARRFLDEDDETVEEPELEPALGD